ncbi:MAG TPA: beta-N-acetylhexosaminidase [Terriglobia bacterium]|nr:beta-N-acetylhexosaminidase [Terriglobia bacterium]
MHSSNTAGRRQVWPVRCILLLAFAICISAFPSHLSAQQPMLIPQPRELHTRAQSFQVNSNLQIVLLTSVTSEDHFAAESVQKELKLVTGQEFPIVGLPEPPQGAPAIVMGRFDQPAMRQLLSARHLSPEGVGAEGYVLDVQSGAVIIAGKAGAGLYYGAQTLRQLIVPVGQEARILGVQVRDWPAMQYRATQVDLSRGPVAKLSFLKNVVRNIAQFKMNQLFVYMEDSFRLEGQPLWGILSDTLSRSDWNELVAYAAPYHVTIVPRTEDCGHLHKVLRFEQYSGMGERPHGHVLAPEDPHQMDLLKTMYQQMLPVFTSPIYFVGCDETFALGTGRSKDLVAKEGYGKVYVDHLNQVAQMVESYNKQVMFSGDIATSHPEIIPNLPKGQIIDSWVYSAHDSYDKWLKPFEGSGLKIFTCPWVGNTSVMVPDYEEAAYNIGHFLAEGKKAGAIGTIVKAWNDDGETMFAPAWWSVIYGAACAWEEGLPDVKDFNRKFDWDFFRDADPGLVEAIMNLGHINEIMRAGKPVETFDMRYGGASDGLFWQNPFSPAGREQVERMLPVASLIRQTAENSYTTFVNSASRAKRNADSLESLEFAALRLDALGMRYQFAQEISERYAEAVASQGGQNRRRGGRGFSDISSTNGRLQDLRDYTTRLTELYRQLWLSENLPNWMPNILQLYRRNSDLWQDLIAKFSDIRYGLRNGQPLPSPESLGLLPAQPGAKQ